MSLPVPPTCLFFLHLPLPLKSYSSFLTPLVSLPLPQPLVSCYTTNTVLAGGQQCLYKMPVSCLYLNFFTQMWPGVFGIDSLPFLPFLLDSSSPILFPSSSYPIFMDSMVLPYVDLLLCPSGLGSKFLILFDFFPVHSVVGVFWIDFLSFLPDSPSFIFFPSWFSILLSNFFWISIPLYVDLLLCPSGVQVPNAFFPCSFYDWIDWRFLN